jgi:hypothetical protein
MDWTSPFIIYRVTADGKLEEVFHAEDIKKAKYWLTYIAQPGDVLCKTPLHPKHSKKNKCPEYWSHKEASGTPATKEQSWLEFVKGRCYSVQFPEEQQKPPEASA